MTLYFSPAPGGYQLRGDNNTPYLFTHADTTISKNEFKEINKGPFIILAIKENSLYKRGVEILFFEKFDSHQQFKSKSPDIDSDTKLYIQYDSSTKLNFLMKMFSNIKDFVNQF